MQTKCLIKIFIVFALTQAVSAMQDINPGTYFARNGHEGGYPEIESGPNLTAFCHNDAVNFVDPDGMKEFSFFKSQSLSFRTQSGPEVSSQLSATLSEVASDFHRSSNKKCACELLYTLPEAGTAWDIIPLAHVGFGEAALHPIGTGDWQRTVAWRGNVYHAGAVNYTLWGQMNRLCNNEFHEYKYSLSNALTAMSIWKLYKYYGVGTGEATAFTRYGYNGTNPNSSAFPTKTGAVILSTPPQENPVGTSFEYYWNGISDAPSRTR